jgi:hypothetical protein
MAPTSTGHALAPTRLAFDRLEDCGLDATEIHISCEDWADREIAAREAAEAPQRADARPEAE